MPEILRPAYESRWSGVSQTETSESHGDGILSALLQTPSMMAGARILTDIPVCAAVSQLCCSFSVNFLHWSLLLCAGWHRQFPPLTHLSSSTLPMRSRMEPSRPRLAGLGSVFIPKPALVCVSSTHASWLENKEGIPGG